MANKIDAIGQSLREELQATAKKMSAILKSGNQRIGMRRMSPEEQAQQFLQMTPLQRVGLKQKYGEEIYASYEEKQLDFLFQRIGPAAVHLLPYVAPNLALAFEERAARMSGEMFTPETPPEMFAPAEMGEEVL